MSQLWQVRESRFTGPGRYDFFVDDETYTVEVDENGYFLLEEPIPFPVGAVARRMDR